MTPSVRLSDVCVVWSSTISVSVYSPGGAPARDTPTVRDSRPPAVGWIAVGSLSLLHGCVVAGPSGTRAFSSVRTSNRR